MDEKPWPISLFRVVYTEQVRVQLMQLVVSAKKRGKAQLMLDALKELDYRLHVYPQFGEPLLDLVLKPAKIWIGVVPPLVAHYSLDDERRLVMVVAPISLLPHSSLNA